MAQTHLSLRQALADRTNQTNDAEPYLQEKKGKRRFDEADLTNKRARLSDAGNRDVEDDNLAPESTADVEMTVEMVDAGPSLVESSRRRRTTVYSSLRMLAMGDARTRRTFTRM